MASSVAIAVSNLQAVQTSVRTCSLAFASQLPSNFSPSFTSTPSQADAVREGFKKSKWKFKMAFAMKGGGIETGLECHMIFVKNHLESFPDCENVFCT